VIVPVGEDPPLSTAVSWTWPPCATPAEAVVEIAGLAEQFEIEKFCENEPEAPLRVWADFQEDDAVTLPLPPGIATVSEDVFPLNGAVPLVVNAAPPVGVNTIFQSGAFIPPLPLPEEENDLQSNVTDLHVAVALPLCACAPATKIARNSTATEATPASAKPRRLTRTASSPEGLVFGGLAPSIVSAGKAPRLVIATPVVSFWGGERSADRRTWMMGGDELRPARLIRNELLEARDPDDPGFPTRDPDDPGSPNQ
jgi:hypothetical protein